MRSISSSSQSELGLSAVRVGQEASLLSLQSNENTMCNLARRTKNKFALSQSDENMSAYDKRQVCCRFKATKYLCAARVEQKDEFENAAEFSTILHAIFLQKNTRVSEKIISRACKFYFRMKYPNTITPSTILYHPNASKLCRRTKFIRNFIAISDTTNAVTTPTASRISSLLAKSVP